MTTESKNSNCLDGIRCPSCGYEDNFYIDVVIETTVYMSDDGHDTDEPMHTMWGDNSRIVCGACAREGQAREFRIVGESDSVATGSAVRTGKFAYDVTFQTRVESDTELTSEELYGRAAQNITASECSFDYDEETVSCL